MRVGLDHTFIQRKMGNSKIVSCRKVPIVENSSTADTTNYFFETIIFLFFVLIYIPLNFKLLYIISNKTQNVE